MPNLEVILPIASHSHSYPLHCPSLGIKVNNTKQALFSFSMSKFRNELLHEILPLSACQTSPSGLWLFDCCGSYNGHDSYNRER